MKIALLIIKSNKIRFMFLACNNIFTTLITTIVILKLNNGHQHIKQSRIIFNGNTTIINYNIIITQKII